MQRCLTQLCADLPLLPMQCLQCFRVLSLSPLTPMPSHAPCLLQPCTSGCISGTCLPASGTCRCFAGYAGASCADCATGFIQVCAAACCSAG